MDKETIACFSITLGGAQLIYERLRERGYSPVEALESIDDRIKFEDWPGLSTWSCQDCNKKFKISEAGHLEYRTSDDEHKEALDWFYHHDCRKTLNLRR